MADRGRARWPRARPPLGQVVHFDHHPVDLEIDAVPVFQPFLAVLVDVLQAVQRLYVTAHREPQLPQPVDRFVVVLERRAPHDLAQLVRGERQLPRRRYLGIPSGATSRPLNFWG